MFWAVPRRTPTRRDQWVALAGLLVATAVLFTWGLSRNGFADAYYSAAAYAGSLDARAMFFGSSDPAGTITVDKPPADLWVMAASVRVFGLNSWALLVPHAAMGVITVWAVYAAVRMVATHAAAMVAGAVMALTPVAVLLFRFNYPDALLTMLVALAAYATLRAVRDGGVAWVAVVGVLVGAGFLTKLIQVFLVVPALLGAYLVAAPVGWGRRVAHVGVALGCAVATAGWWVVAVDAVPAGERPYIGSSANNSVYDLIVGYNGLGRLSGEVGPGSGTDRWGVPGPGRLFGEAMGGQVAWMLPAALLVAAVGLVATRRRPRGDLMRAALVVWGGWLLATGLVFSFMAGTFHEYYTVALVPPIAALVGVGVGQITPGSRRAAWAAAAAVVMSALWGAVLLQRAGGSYAALALVVAVAGVLAGAAMVVCRARPRAWGAAVAAAAVVLAAGPLAFDVATVRIRQRGTIVAAGPGVPQGLRITPSATALSYSDLTPAGVRLLTRDAGRYRWVAAVVGSQYGAADLQLALRAPVMPVGGFLGTDPAPTPAAFRDLVRAGRIHYFAVPSTVAPGALRGGSGTIAAWVRQRFAPISVDGRVFYDLTRPKP